MSEADTVRIEVCRPVAATADRVYDAWLDPAIAARFLFTTPGGQIIRAEIDPVVGGELCIVDRRDGEDIEHLGEWVVLKRPAELAFDLSVNQSPVSRVRVEIAPRAGGCEVRLTHTMAAQWAAHAGRAEQGWSIILEALERALA